MKVSVNYILQFLIIFISFTAFTLHYTLYWIFAGIFAILVFIYFTLYNYKLKIFKGYIIIFLLYLVFFLMGLGNIAFLHDLRLNIIWFGTLFIYYNFFKHNGKYPRVIIRIIFYINIYIAAFYLFVKFGLIANYYEVEKLAAYQDYRTIGPALSSLYILPFLYSIFKLKKDRIYYLNFFICLISLFINGSLQSLALFLLIYGISYFDTKNTIAFIKKSAIVLILIIVFVLTIFSNFDMRKKEKVKEIFNLSKSETIQMRVKDFKYIFPMSSDTWKKIIIGSGVGVNSVILRVNEDYPSLTGYRAFLEIDNGFFYIYHRSGIVGLMLILYSHFILIFKIRNLRSRLIFITFFIITNLLSYDYWSYVAAPFFIAAILHKSNHFGVSSPPLAAKK